MEKLEEVSRNELLALTKGETITRYNKAQAYKGFSIVNIDTTDILYHNALVITCKVGDYNDTVELEDILYWIEMSAEYNQGNQINTKGVTQAIMNSIDGMDIKVDCTCGDFKYRFAYQATVLGYKYGRPENRPNRFKRTNKDNHGALCKHLTSMLSNKRWLQQVTSKVMDWLEENIDDVNAFLNLSGDKVLTLPNELARQNAKYRWQKAREQSQEEPQQDVEPDSSEQTPQDNKPSNVQGNNPSTNRLNNINDEEVTDNNEQ